MKKSLFLFALTVITGNLLAQTKSAAIPPGLSSIKSAEIKRDLFELAGDEFRGRKAGTLEELRAAAWVAQKAMEAGLKPAGDDGTFFQFFSLKRTRTSNSSSIKINNEPVELWQDAFPTQHINSKFQGPVVWLKSMADSTTAVSGKIVAMRIQAPQPLPASGMSLWGYRYTASAIRQQSSALRNQGAAAIILVADKTVEESLAFTGHNFEEGTYQPETAEPAANAAKMMEPIPVILVTSKYGEVLQKAGASVAATFRWKPFCIPLQMWLQKQQVPTRSLKKNMCFSAVTMTMMEPAIRLPATPSGMEQMIMHQ